MYLIHLDNYRTWNQLHFFFFVNHMRVKIFKGWSLEKCWCAKTKVGNQWQMSSTFEHSAGTAWKTFIPPNGYMRLEVARKTIHVTQSTAGCGNWSSWSIFISTQMDAYSLCTVEKICIWDPWELLCVCLCLCLSSEPSVCIFSKYDCAVKIIKRISFVLVIPGSNKLQGYKQITELCFFCWIWIYFPHSGNACCTYKQYNLN